MASVFRWLALLLAAIVLTAILQPWVVKWLDSVGWYTTPTDTVVPFMNWIAKIIGDTAFPWFAGIVFGLAIGSWAHYMSTRLDNSKPSKEEKFIDLQWLIKSLGDDIWETMRTPSGVYDFNRRSYPLDLKIKSLYSEIRALGISTPDYSTMGNEEYNVGNQAFLQSLIPFSARGQVKVAKQVARENISDFKRAVKSNQIPPKTAINKQP